MSTFSVGKHCLHSLLMSCSFHDRISSFTCRENILQYGSLEIGQIQLWQIVTVPSLGYSAFIIFFMKFLYLWLVTLIKRVVQNKCGCFPRLYIFTFNLYLPRSPHDKYMRCSILSGWIDKGTHISVHCLHMQAFDFCVCFLARQKPDFGEESLIFVLKKT